MRDILSQLPADFPVPILYLQHLSASHPGGLAAVLQYRTALNVRWARHGDRLMPGVVYLCPAGSVFIVRSDATIGLTPIASRRDTLRSADLFLSSVAEAYAGRAVAIVLSGAGSDGAEGVCAVHGGQGTVLVQDEASSAVWGMPKAAIATGCVDFVLPARDIAPLLIDFVRHRHSLACRRVSVNTTPVSVSPLLRDVLCNVLATALTMHRTVMGNIQLFSPHTGALCIVTQRGFGLDFLEYFQTVGMQSDSACGRAMRDRAAVLIPDIAVDPLFALHRDIAREAGFRAVQSTPLISRRGAFLGVLSTHFRRPRIFPEEEFHKVERHAGFAAEMIERLLFT
jgi:hypothetical protein